MPFNLAFGTGAGTALGKQIQKPSTLRRIPPMDSLHPNGNSGCIFLTFKEFSTIFSSGKKNLDKS
jgi:hypothetical protein